MTKEEFEAVFDIFLEGYRLTSEELMGKLRSYCEKNWDGVERIENPADLYKYLEKALEEIEPDYAATGVDAKIGAGVMVIFSWGAVLIKIPADKMSRELVEKLNKATEDLSPFLVDFFAERGVDLAEIYESDPEQIGRFKKLMQEIDLGESGERSN